MCSVHSESHEVDANQTSINRSFITPLTTPKKNLPEHQITLSGPCELNLVLSSPSMFRLELKGWNTQELWTFCCLLPSGNRCIGFNSDFWHEQWLYSNTWWLVLSYCSFTALANVTPSHGLVYKYQSIPVRPLHFSASNQCWSAFLLMINAPNNAIWWIQIRINKSTHFLNKYSLSANYTS